MEKINQNLTIPERIAIGKSFAKMLFEKYAAIESIIIYGSTVRGDCLPVSDLDMHCIVSKSSDPLPLEKGVHNGVFIDIEADYKEDLSAEKVLSDGYLFGLINDCIVLFDRTGFMMWCLSDYLLPKYRSPAGGFRTLARLKMINTDAYLDILKLQDSIFRTKEELKSFSDLSFSLWNVEKTEWMFDNGFKDDAFHTLWIDLGLKIKEVKLHPNVAANRQIAKCSEKWLKRLNWNEGVLYRKGKEMKDLIKTYVPLAHRIRWHEDRTG